MDAVLYVHTRLGEKFREPIYESPRRVVWGGGKAECSHGGWTVLIPNDLGTARYLGGRRTPLLIPTSSSCRGSSVYPRPVVRYTTYNFTSLLVIETLAFYRSSP